MPRSPIHQLVFTPGMKIGLDRGSELADFETVVAASLKPDTFLDHQADGFNRDALVGLVYPEDLSLVSQARIGHVVLTVMDNPYGSLEQARKNKELPVFKQEPFDKPLVLTDDDKPLFSQHIVGFGIVAERLATSDKVNGLTRTDAWYFLRPPKIRYESSDEGDIKLTTSSLLAASVVGRTVATPFFTQFNRQQIETYQRTSTQIGIGTIAARLVEAFSMSQRKDKR